MSQINRIIFIDEENTRLSPFAAQLLKKKLNREGIEMEVYSRGTIVLFPEPANQKISEIALEYGIVVSGHQAIQLSQEDFERNTLILALDNASKKRAYDTRPETINIFTLREYVGENGDLRLPIGESLDKYWSICEQVDKLLELLVKKLEEA